MKKHNFLLRIIAIILLLFGGEVYSQYVWQQTQEAFIGSDSTNFQLISSYHNVVVACGPQISTNSKQFSLVVFRSDDAGRTWEKKNTLPIGINNDVDEVYTTIQQIDSLHTIVGGYTNHFGDTALILKTNDGGGTWSKSHFLFRGLIVSMHFSDSLTGMLICQDNDTDHFVRGGGTSRVYITSDGGFQWNMTPFSETPNLKTSFQSFFSLCHSYGKNMYRIFRYNTGKIYTTNDNWVSVDSTSQIIDGDLGSQYHFFNCTFSEDTIIASGGYSADGVFTYAKVHAIIVRSTNAGKSWGEVQHFPDFVGVSGITDIAYDTIIAASQPGNTTKGIGKILLSSDKGVSWHTDTVTVPTKASDWLHALTMTSSGPVGIYGGDNWSNNPSALVRSKQRASSVREIAFTDSKILYPNPVVSSLHFTTKPRHSSLYDVLGRKVKELSPEELRSGKVDCTELQSGIYYITADGHSYKFVKE